MEEVRKFILDYFKIMYRSNDVVFKEQKEWLEKISDKDLKHQISTRMIDTIIKPFSEPSFDDLKDAAKFLGIELDEQIVITNQNNMVPERPVPVGLKLARL